MKFGLHANELGCFLTWFAVLCTLFPVNGGRNRLLADGYFSLQVSGDFSPLTGVRMPFVCV